LGAHCLDLIDEQKSKAAELGDNVSREESVSSQTENISEDDRIQMAVMQETVLRLLR
jgi:hypothetical protein